MSNSNNNNSGGGGRSRSNSTSQRSSSFLSGMFGWMGTSRNATSPPHHNNNNNNSSSSSPYSTQNIDNDRVSEEYALKHDPSLFLTTPQSSSLSTQSSSSQSPSNVEIAKTANHMKKMWQQYESLPNEVSYPMCGDVHMFLL